MFYRTEDGVFDICQACNLKIKVRGSKSAYPMRRHLDSRRHKDAVSRDVSRGGLNPFFSSVFEDPTCKEAMADAEHILEKPVYPTFSVADIRGMRVVMVEGEENTPDIPTSEKPLIPVLEKADTQTLEKTVIQPLSEEDIRGMVEVVMPVDAEDKVDISTIEKPVIPTLSGNEIRQTVENYYKNWFRQI